MRIGQSLITESFVRPPLVTYVVVIFHFSIYLSDDTKLVPLLVVNDLLTRIFSIVEYDFA
jgi:hypothetical protein